MIFNLRKWWTYVHTQYLKNLCCYQSALDNSLIFIQRIKERNGMHLNQSVLIWYFGAACTGNTKYDSYYVKCFRKNNEDRL